MKKQPSSEFMPGLKTYGIGAAMILFGVLGYSLGYMDTTEAGRVILEGFGLITLRLGIAKVE